MKLVLLVCNFAALAECASMLSTDIYDQSLSTQKGCKCSSECKTSLAFHCYIAPFCTVKDKKCDKGAAEWSHTENSHYDWCTYDPYQTYELLTAAKKKAIVLAHVKKDPQSGSYPKTVHIMTESVRVTFEASSDVFPQVPKRKKYIHSVGTVGGIRFESSGDHPYSGLLKGASHGILRFSAATDPKSEEAIAPGMAIKFFRDGRPSANVMAMFSFNGQQCSDNNFLKHEWSNHVDPGGGIALKIITAKFWQASYCPSMVGLSDLATDANGTAGSFPFKLSFRFVNSNGQISSDCDCKNYAQCLENLGKNLPVGTELAEVRAQDSPSSEERVIGHITVTDTFTTSKFGDEDLFFKHQLMEDDFTIKPKWLAAIDKVKQCSTSLVSTKPPTTQAGCDIPKKGLSVMVMLIGSAVAVSLLVPAIWWACCRGKGGTAAAAE